LRSFVFSFGVHVLKSELRRKKARAWLSFHRPEVLVELGAGTLDVEGRDLLRRFYGLLDQLSAEDRLVFSLRHLESMTVEEVAATMSLSVSTVKRRLNHGMKRFARLLQNDPELELVLEGKGWRSGEGRAGRAP
jgi:RNA polymerase sigma factor (sigma-70 family)